MKSKSILIVEEYLLLAEALGSSLEHRFDVRGYASDGRRAKDLAGELRPDLIVMNIDVPMQNGIEVTKLVKAILPDTDVVLYGGNVAAHRVAESFRAGVSAYVSVWNELSNLIHAIDEVIQGRQFLSHEFNLTVQELLADFPAKNSARGLSDFESNVIHLLAEGYGLKEVAAILDTNMRMVAYHKYRAMEELGLKTNADLIRYAIESGSIPGPACPCPNCSGNTPANKKRMPLSSSYSQALDISIAESIDKLRGVLEDHQIVEALNVLVHPDLLSEV